MSNEIYGDYRNPQDFGSGGGGSGGTVTAGGGLVEIQTTNLVVDGRIRANAESANLGSGSGGGIKITTGILSGTGIISANGGSSNTPFIGNGNGSGGGGRVAVYAADFTTFDTSKITAFGGVTKGGDGAAGTVYLRDTDLALGTLAFDPGTGGKAATMLGLSTQSTVTISDNLVISHIISRPQHSGMTFSILGNLSVVNGGSITANVATTTTTDPLSLTISGTLRVDSQSTIDVSGDGYLSGRTYGNSIAGASTGFSGGSYGGFGGASLGTPNPTYGDFENPQDFGSGGGSLGGFPGGGVALIQAENIILDGRIWANGVNHGSAGSGGSVRISTRILSGAGSITANGGSTDSGAGWGSGGGGRVAVYADDFTTFDTAKITAFGGGTGVKGTPGTVYLRLLSQPLGTVIIDGGSGAGESAVIVLGRPEQSMITFDGNLIITRGIVRPEHTGMLFTVTGNLSVVNGGILSTNSATATSVDALSLVVKGSLTVDATSSIDVTGKGYLQGRTNRNTTAGASTGNSGGSFGGLGGGSSGTPNSVYGDSANPLNAGSGGANAPGGGQIDIKAGALVVNGAIRADGTGAAGGSGSGGGIKIVTGSLSGSGRISATGGATTNGTGSGGGGRVAVYSANFTSFDTSKITAAGGSTGVKGAAGSVYLAPLDAAGSTSPFGPSTELFVPLYSFPQFTDFTRTALAGWWRDIRDQATAANPITVIINPSNGTADPTNPASDFGVYRDAIRLLRQNPYVRILGYVYTQGGSRPQADVIQNIGWYQNYYLTSGGSSMVDGIFIDQLAASASQLGYYQTLAANIRGRSELAGTMIVANSGVVPEAGLLTDAIADVLVTFEDVENSAVANHTHFVDAVRPTGGSANLKYGAILHGVPTAADRDRVIRPAKIKGYSFLFVTDDAMDTPFDVKPTYWSGIPTELNRPVVPDRAVSIAENSANATVVDTIPGFDPTPGQTIAYSIVGGNVGNAFAINPTTGQLTVNNSAALDFETTPSFTLAVQVTDNGSPALSGTGTVTVQLTDVPDSSDIRVNSATTNGQSTITVNYSVLFADAPAFDLRFAKSAGRRPGRFPFPAQVAWISTTTTEFW
ncbi:MAG: cadherin domain-containing protein [Planctomycetota bacterium]|nr:cadherin domain-containing protein [Planctomycetota bacterium]